MASFTQANRALTITTPLGPDVLLLRGFTGTEAISHLFAFQLDLVAGAEVKVPFEKLLGERVSVGLELPDGSKRFFSGMVKRIVEGGRSTGQVEMIGTSYRMEVVPEVWLLTRRVRSRIFQQVTVPDILQQVFTGMDVDFQIQGTFEPRNFCVQYRESDFDFASRLMEEEGIYYFFEHKSGGSHKMILANSPTSHPEMPGVSSIEYEEMEGGGREEGRILSWERRQELRSGKMTLWDHNFELPQKNLEATVPIMDSVSAGTINHKLTVGKADANEVYDYPGDYAKRFDGIDPGGGDRAGDLQKIFDDNVRTVKIRMQQEEVDAVVINGRSACRQFVPGYKFTLKNHRNGNGAYVLTSVTHTATLGDIGRSGSESEFGYSNQFTCIPHALPFRPIRRTPRPRVEGCQTATVVGPDGEEIFVDKYGRVKVQFHWDREGKKDAKSACWLRVGTPWAGKQWGMVHIPRIGHEVIVDFLEGDPDRPIITGMVYNPDYMPPWTLPEHKTRSGIRTRSTPKGAAETFNELRFEDKKGQEHIYLHAEKNLRVAVEADEMRTIGRHNGTLVRGARAVVVEGEAKIDLSMFVEAAEEGEVEEGDGGEMVGDTLIVEKNRFTHVGMAEAHQIQEDFTIQVVEGNHLLEILKGNHTVTVTEGDQEVTVHGSQTTDVETGDYSLTVAQGNAETTVETGNHSLAVDTGNASVRVKTGNQTLKVDLGKVTQEAMQSIELKVGSNSIKIDQSGIKIKGIMVTIEGDAMLKAKSGAMTQVEGGAMLMLKGALTMIN